MILALPVMFYPFMTGGNALVCGCLNEHATYITIYVVPMEYFFWIYWNNEVDTSQSLPISSWVQKNTLLIKKNSQHKKHEC